MPNRVIKWDDKPIAAFQAALSFIRKHSFQGAEKVKSDIIERIDKLAKHPEFCPPDKWKMVNSGEFRAFELHHYRVSYQIKKEEIIIVRFRHTSQAPQAY